MGSFEMRSGESSDGGVLLRWSRQESGMLGEIWRIQVQTEACFWL